MNRRCLAVLLALAALTPAQKVQPAWRSATEAELKVLIPARAPVEKERIETEFRTASGITDGHGKFVAGVVLITAGYAAEGKYSNFFIVQAPLAIGDLHLLPGTYVFGWRRNGDDALEVKFYDSQSGRFLGTAPATRTSRIGRIESFHVSPPTDKSLVQIGRFAMKYQLVP